MLEARRKKIAIVTGANGGIGRVLIKWLEKGGVRCICVDKEGIPSDNFLLCDLSQQTEVQNLIKIISSKFEVVDLLFNVAGIGIYKKIEDLTVKEWNDSLAINLSAPYILLKGLLPLLKKSNNPLVVNFGSGMGVEPTAERIAYCTSKFGLRGLSLSLSKEFRNEDVKIVLLTLGSIMTNFGTGGLGLRKRLAENGKKYLMPDEVVKKVIEIINSPTVKPEYVMYPQGYLSGS